MAKELDNDIDDNDKYTGNLTDTHNPMSYWKTITHGKQLELDKALCKIGRKLRKKADISHETEKAELGKAEGLKA